MHTQSIRRTAVAGQFYPDDPAQLHTLTAKFMAESGVDADPDRVDVVVVPHAGFMYSGPTAGHAYARIRGKKPARAILIGCSHRYAFPTAAVWTEGCFESPAGAFPIDEAFAGQVARAFDSIGEEPHAREHSLEVQLPFLMEAVGPVPIVPILFGAPASGWHAEAGRILAEMAGPGDLVITSTDLSHFLSNDEANAIDQQSIQAVLKKDWRAYTQGIEDGTCAMCGAAAVTAAMTYALARDAGLWQVLDYRTSAHASGDYNRVVGYAALSMEHAA